MSAFPVFKIASEEWEFQAIHELNYRTFVEEIPQHAPRRDKCLVDRFHRENTYVICLVGPRLVGMLSLRSSRPFSLDHKLSNLDDYLPKARSIVEVRLLSIEPEYRKSRILVDLLHHAFELAKTAGYDLAIISGTTRQLKLYKHLGFVSFGPPVGAADALFQPMYLTRDALNLRACRSGRLPEGNQRISFLPGPVEIPQHVRRALASLPDSHRGSAFLARFARTTDALCRLVNSNHVALLLGSGTLANDMVAGQLSLLQERGLILSNGEFGERLTDHAARFGLEFDVYRLPWGQSFDETQLRARLAASPRCRWLWAVHCETSTGVLNHIAMLVRSCKVHGVKVCLDCISSIGVLPLDLSATTFATGVSGKGLAAYPGLSMVFFNHDRPEPSKRLPRYLDLGIYAQASGVAFTHSSNLVAALEAALEGRDSGVATERVRELSIGLREELSRRGFRPIAVPQAAVPAILTLEPPQGFDAQTLGERLEEAGFLVAFRSAYLTYRNWIQVCLMGAVGKRHVHALLSAVDNVLSGQARPLTTPEHTETLMH